MSEKSDYADALLARIAELERYVTSAEIAFREKNDRIEELETEITRLRECLTLGATLSGL